MINKTQLLVEISKVDKSFKLKVAHNIEFEHKIRLIEGWDYNRKEFYYKIGPLPLYKLILSYKGRKDIFFKFADDKLKANFLERYQRALKKEEEAERLADIKRQQYAYDLEFKNHLESTATELPMPSGLKKDFKPYPHQLVSAYFLDRVRRGLLSLEMGLGKAMPLSTPILTPTGWVRMGDLQVGDKVVSTDGKASKVTGVFPQGIKDIYRVTFSDGSTAECCDEHLWSVNTTTRNFRGHPHLTMSLKEIMGKGLQFKNGNNRWYIPITKPIEFEDHPTLSIDPYLLGCLLGDAHLKGTISMVCDDYEIIAELSKRLPENTTINKQNKNTYSFVRTVGVKNVLKQNVKSLLLYGELSNSKHIPSEYLFSTMNERVELLQGLMDTDGSVYKDGTLQYFTVSERLMEDVRHLVQSLGGVCRVNEKQGKYKKDGVVIECQVCYTMTINLPQEIIPFKLSRKVERLKQVKKYNPSRAIVKVEYVGQEEAQCISVDAEDHLYITNNFVVTHNTLCSIMFVEMQRDKFKKVLVVTPNSLKHNYANEVERFTHSNAYVYQGLTTKKGRAEEEKLIKEAKYIIINYEYFNARPVPKFKKEKDANKRFYDAKAKFDGVGIPLADIDCVICDESHKLKNETANTTINFMATFANKENLVLMTGTPAPNRVEELWTAINMLAPVIFRSKADYMLNYCGFTLDPQYGTYVVKEMPKTKEIYDAMAPFSYRKKKEEVLKDLPDKVSTRIYLDITDADMKKYKEVEEGVAVEIFDIMRENKSLNDNVTLLRLRQYTSYLKSVYMTEMFERMIAEDEKIVIFDAFKETLDNLHRRYSYNSVLHTGDIEDLAERARRVAQFQTDEDMVMFLGSNQTCNAGLTLTASNKLFLMTQPFSVGENDQLADRVHRIGQKNFCNIYIPVIRGTFDEVVYKIVENKRSELSLAIDNQEYNYNYRRMELEEMMNYFSGKYKGR